MSGDTVTGEALQFTNDNKFAYAMSGSFSLTNSAGSAVDTLLKFTTTSSYVVGKLDVSNTATSTETMYVQLIYDGVVVINNKEAHPAPAEPLRFDILIPPNTEVELKVGTGGSSIVASAMITGKVGMPQRVGNLDE